MHTAFHIQEQNSKSHSSDLIYCLGTVADINDASVAPEIISLLRDSEFVRLKIRLCGIESLLEDVDIAIKYALSSDMKNEVRRLFQMKAICRYNAWLIS